MTAPLTGNIIYPVCQVANPEATEAESTATQALLAFLQTDYCLQAFEGVLLHRQQVKRSGRGSDMKAIWDMVLSFDWSRSGSRSRPAWSLR